MDIGAHGKNPLVVRVICFFFFFFFSFFLQDNPGQVCKQEDGFEQFSDCVYAVSFVIKYLQTIRNTISKLCTS